MRQITKIALVLLLFCSPLAAQEITIQDYIGVGASEYDGNTDFTSADDAALGLYAYSGQRIRFINPAEITEVWAVVVPYNGFDFNSPEVIQYRIALWSSIPEFRLNPNAPNLGEVSLPSPNLGDTVNPVGTGFWGDDMFLIGFDIEGLGLNAPTCTTCVIALIVENDFNRNGAIGIAESDVDRRVSRMITNSSFFPRTQPTAISIARDISWAQTSSASLSMLIRGKE